MITDNATMTSKGFEPAATNISSHIDYYCPVCKVWFKFETNDQCITHRKACITASQMVPIPPEDQCDVMTVEEFGAAVQEGAFINSDGHGYYANATMMSPEAAIPSWIKKHGLLEGWTKVVWFNK